MAFTYGFYNAINNDRLYDAIQMSEIFDGIIRDGVYATIGNHYICKQNLVNGAVVPNTVIVGSGRAWFDHTWNKLDVDTVYTGPPSEKASNRYDAIVLDINATERTNDILWITGTPSNNPAKPALIHDTDHMQYPLCYLYRRAGTDLIDQANIENAVGTNACPFVSGILETIDLEDLLLQWSAQWVQTKNTVNSEWTQIKNKTDSEWTQIKNTYSSEWTNIKNTTNKEWSDIKTNLTKEQQDIVVNLSQWIDGIRDQLTEEAETSLQLQVNRANGLVSKETIFETNGNITENLQDGSKKITKFPSQTQIIEEFYGTDGSTLIATKTTDFLSNGNIKETVVYK